MKEIVLITGGKGMIATALSSVLLENGYEVRLLTRKKEKPGEYEWDLSTQYIEDGAFDQVSHIIHLAGANIAGKRWTSKRKRELLDSRVKSADLISARVAVENTDLKTFITASATGYYGTRETNEAIDETANSGDDFLAKLCVQWESAADQFRQVSETRVIKLRFGMVLSKTGGALDSLSTPIRWYVGAPLGTGKQYMPWIHIQDICHFILYALGSADIQGIYNIVAPDVINNKELTKSIAKQLKRPLLLPNIPAGLLKLLVGEMAVTLLKGNIIIPRRMLQSGYPFLYPNLEQALKQVYGEGAYE